jgi:DedD protein
LIDTAPHTRFILLHTGTQMGFLSIFKRRTGATASVTNEAVDDVQKARTRARQRLIGASVLVGAGVVGFPLVFETQPRPIAVDIPITLPRKEAVAPLVAPPARRTPNRAAATASVTNTPPSRPAAVAAVPAFSSEIITETRAEAGRELPPPSPPLTMSPKRTAAAASSAAPKLVQSTTRVAQAPEVVTKPVTTPKPAPAASSSGPERFVVQIGAYAEPNAALDVRKKMEKVGGFRVYTQVTQSPEGERVRVRLGPFTSRTDAELALSKAKNAGLAAVVLSI